MCARLNENVNKSFRQQSKMSSSTVIKVVVILCILCLSYQVYAELIFQLSGYSEAYCYSFIILVRYSVIMCFIIRVYCSIMGHDKADVFYKLEHVVQCMEPLASITQLQRESKNPPMRPAVF